MVLEALPSPYALAAVSIERLILKFSELEVFGDGSSFCCTEICVGIPLCLERDAECWFASVVSPSWCLATRFRILAIKSSVVWCWAGGAAGTGGAGT